MTKKLNYENGVEIFKNNEKLRERVWMDALENDAYYQADEILSYFRHYNETTQKRFETLKDYSIDYCGAYYDMSDTNYNRLEKWIETTINEACEYIAQYAQEFYTQFDDAGILEDYFLTIWLEYNDNFQVDENGHIYETITRCIA